MTYFLLLLIFLGEIHILTLGFFWSSMITSCVMIHPIHAHKLLHESKLLQTRQLELPSGPTKRPLIKRAQINNWPLPMVVAHVALDQNDPEQIGLEQMLWPPALAKDQHQVLQYHQGTDMPWPALARTRHQVWNPHLEGPVQHSLQP